jgi:subfamily B ATP-binding cassette protein MsbA
MYIKKNKNFSYKSLIVRLLKEHVLEYKKNFFWALVCMIITALATSSLPYLLQPVFDEVFAKNNMNSLFLVTGSIFVCFILKGFSSYGESIIMTYIGQKIISDIQLRLFKRLMFSDLSFFQNNPSGELLSKFTNDVSLMRNAMTNTVIGLGKDTLTLIFLIGLMFYRDTTLAFIAFFVLPVVILPVINIGRKMRKITNSTQEKIGYFTYQLNQIFQNIKIVKANCREKYEIGRIGIEIQKIFDLIYKTAKVRSATHPIVESLAGLAIVLVIAYGGWQVMHGNRTTGEFISFIGALLLSYEPIKRLSNLNTNIQEGLAAASRVFKIIDSKSLIESEQNLKVIDNFKAEIQFKNVCFSYANHKKVMKNINFIAKSGSTVAFVGASGAGKSTLLTLLPRFYDVESGHICIDNVNIKDISLEFLRKNIALVNQETNLFDVSIKENVAYGNPLACEKDIVEACKMAFADEFIERMPDGYNTVIGENGLRLSGGQKQRIAIARAILKNAPILLLDEATSALDSESEQEVQNALQVLMKGRTTIVVAHRLSTIVNADIIYVMNHGEIVESGNHSDLLEAKGAYANLWRSQLKLKAKI